MKPRGEVMSRKVRMSNPASRPKLLLMVQLLEKSFQLLSCCSTATRRELYYQLMLPSKNALTSALRSVCSLLGAAPWELGILASSKGLVAGPLRLSLPSEIISCSVQGGERTYLTNAAG